MERIASEKYDELKADYDRLQNAAAKLRGTMMKALCQARDFDEARTMMRQALLDYGIEI